MSLAPPQGDIPQIWSLAIPVDCARVTDKPDVIPSQKSASGRRDEVRPRQCSNLLEPVSG
jgi:hypothetical protein